MKPISPEREHEITKAAEDVVDLVNNGASPNDAVFKVATDTSLTPDFVRRLVEVFNVGRSLHHFKTASADERAAEFPLADADTVLQRMYPSAKQRAKEASEAFSSAWFAPPPNFNVYTELVQKAAAELTVPPPQVPATPEVLDRLLKRAYRQRDALRVRYEVAQGDANIAKQALGRDLQKAAEYFRQRDRMPFNEVESDFVTQYGARGQAVMDTLYKWANLSRWNEKRGSVSPTPRLYDPTVQPYTYLETILERTRQLQKASSDAECAKAELDEFVAAIDSRMAKHAAVRKGGYPLDHLFKSAAALPTLANMLFINDKVGDMFQTTPPDTTGFEAQVNRSIDPEHNRTLRAATVKAMLNEMLTSDPVISQHDPEQVVQAYDRLATTFPTLTSQPELLRGLLSKHLEMGGTDPYEFMAAVDAEKKLRPEQLKGK